MALWDDVTECWDFENDATAEKTSSHNLTAENTPGYSNADYKQGAYSADLDDASTEYFHLADNGSAGSAQDFDVGADVPYSIAFWVKYDDITNQGNVASKYTSGNGWKIEAYYISGTNYGIKIRQYASWNNSDALTGVALSNGTWYHVVISHNPANATEMTVWISTSTFGDVLNAGTFNMDYDPGLNTADLYIGATDATHVLDGHLDEFAFFYNKAVDATEAESIFDGTGAGGWRAAGGASIPRSNPFSRPFSQAFGRGGL